MLIASIEQLPKKQEGAVKMTVTYGTTTGNNSQPNYQDAINIANQVGNQIAQMAGQISAISQHEIIYNIQQNKNAHVRNLREGMFQNYSGQIYITDHIFHAVRHAPEYSVINFFSMQTAPANFENSIVILSNNNVMVDGTLDKFIQLYQNSPTSIFVIWDFDNHHWLALSCMLATFSDLYVPTHADNLELLSRFNNTMAGPVPSGVIQWPKEFLEDNIDVITKTERSNEPLGTHIDYPQFINRDRILKKLSKQMDKVKLVDGSYHSRSMEDRFKEWCSHKVHWIVPVLNDAPIRIFDALITGGIPIIPKSLKYHKAIVDIWDHVVFYDYLDIENPKLITEKAIKMFDERGEQGMLDRHRISCYNNHVDSRIETILKAIEDEFNIKT
jgi:hypothetical protein